MVECDPDWCHLGKDENGIEMNQYFVGHPDMVLGSMVTESGPFGPQTTCKPLADMELSEGKKISEGVGDGSFGHLRYWCYGTDLLCGRG